MTAVLLLVACATTVPKPSPASPPPTPAVSIPLAPPPGSGDARFDAFLEAARTEALAQGIRPQTWETATRGIAPIAAIAAMNQNQPEFAKPVWSYLDSAVSARRVADAKILLARNGAMLDGIAAQSGVPREILVAIWGMETDYGRDTGGFNLFAALATLAYQGPRADYAKPEFLAALRILQEQGYPPAEMVASWAGAFGQTQFTPTTFLKYAADGDGDNHIDLWSSSADALASAANLLKSQGWAPGAPWGLEVKLPATFAWADADLDTVKPVADWKARGVTPVHGGALPDAGEGAIYLPAGARGPAFLVFANFKVILKYNNAASYALAVGLLADRMAGAAPLTASWPRDERALSHDERLRFQTELTALGFDAGAPDGVLGRRTRAATRAWQASRKLAADGYPTASLLALLDAQVRY
jgi:membrane-bound lytic murein transglycosylase B